MATWKPFSDRVVTPERAHEALGRFIAGHFGNKEKHPRFCVPVEEDDDDMVLSDYIAQAHNAAEALAVAVEALEAAEEKFQRIQNVALPTTMVMARACDGEEEARSALARIAELKADKSVQA